jgi:hypothetical protein
MLEYIHRVATRFIHIHALLVHSYKFSYIMLNLAPFGFQQSNRSKSVESPLVVVLKDAFPKCRLLFIVADHRVSRDMKNAPRELPLFFLYEVSGLLSLPPQWSNSSLIACTIPEFLLCIPASLASLPLASCTSAWASRTSTSASCTSAMNDAASSSTLTPPPLPP